MREEGARLGEGAGEDSRPYDQLLQAVLLGVVSESAWLVTAHNKA